MGINRLSAVLLLILNFSHAIESASILALFSSLSFSDHIVFRAYVSLLTQRGHSVVVMTPYPGHFQYPDIEKIVELDVGQESAKYWDEYKNLVTTSDDYYIKMRSLNELSIKVVIAQLRSKQMTALFINPNIKFDLVITEADVPVLYAVADKYKAPHIAITASTGKLHQHEAKGNPVNPLLYPDVNTLNYGNLNLWQKLTEFNRHFQTRYEYYNNHLPLCQITAEKIFGFKRDLMEVEEDIDLLLIAANPLLSGNRPNVPAVVYVDRMHINPGLKLSQKLKTILNAAAKGVIYFSLGAVAESENLPKQLLQTLADVFRELPYTVIWKIGNTSMIEMPNNVVAQAWFPQQEILAHVNVKAFITHGGLRSLEEAVFYEVPIIGLPIVKSRKVFIKEISKHGAGEVLDLYSLDKDTLKTTISVVASNEKYKNAMSKVKHLTNDPIISGPEKAVWWTEYVLRNGGAHDLRSPNVGNSFIKFYMLDVISFLLAGVLLFIIVVYTLFCFVRRCLRNRFLAKHENSGKFKEL